jgi:thiamine pyrophosphate-dependent acetolactate synthase large subunit-like protein
MNSSSLRGPRTERGQQHPAGQRNYLLVLSEVTLDMIQEVAAQIPISIYIDSAPAPQTQAVEKARELLIGAKRPVIMAGRRCLTI